MLLSKRTFLFVLLTVSLTIFGSLSSMASDLTDAVKAKNLSLVRSLLAAGADLKQKVRGDYPLNAAALFGPVEMVTLLLDAGADINQPGRDGLRPLHNAVYAGRGDIVALLLQKGAMVDAKDMKGRTPLLTFAATAGRGSDIEIAKKLLNAGADPNTENAKEVLSISALQYAAENGNLEMAQLLILAGADVNHRDADGWSPLHQAVLNRRLDIARLLIANGADVNLENKLANKPLFYAGTEEAMRRLLVEAGAR